MACPSECATCESSTKCLTCINAYYFSENTCLACVANCDECTGAN